MTSPFQRDDLFPGNLPALHRIPSPEEFQQLQTLGSDALRTPGILPLLPPIPKPVSESTRTGAAPANPQSQQLTGAKKTAADAFGMAASAFEHPVETVANMALAPVMSLYHAALRTSELQARNDLARRGEDYNQIPLTGTGKSDAEDLVQLGAMAAAGPLGSKMVEALSPVVGRVGAGLLTKMGVGAGLGAAFNPDNPEAGALLGAAGGFAHHLAAPVTLTPELHAALQTHMDRVVDAWNQTFAPAARSPEAGEAALVIRSTTGQAARRYEQAAWKLDEFRRAIDPLSDPEKLDFIDAIEGGRAQAQPEFQPLADVIRQTLDDHREAIQALGTGKLEYFIENYFPHIWEDPERATDAFAAAGSKRPMEGSGSFLKHRTIPTTAEGIALGLTPVTTNPIDLTLLKVREMGKYLMAHESLNELKENGLVSYVPAGGVVPDAYTKINDKIATVFGPRTGAVSVPEGAVQGLEYTAGQRGITSAEPVLPEDIGVYGRRIMGEYWAPEPVARVVNNYLSPGLRGNAIYDAYRGLGNTLNQAQLGLSGFHLMFTSMDASVSRAALGLEYIASGQPLEGLKKLVSTPGAPLTNMKLGARVRAAYLDPNSEQAVTIGNAVVPRGAVPELRSTPRDIALANAVAEAGGRVTQDSFYKNSAPSKLIDAWKQGEYGKAAAFSLPSLFEFASEPIMEHIVPLQKLGVFGDMARKVFSDLPEGTSQAETRQALASAWDSVDNRMGQMVYDNLFWNKTFKDLAMASVRSVGWNLGTIRELGGGSGDIFRGNFSHRAAYVAALPIVTGMYGATLQYLLTGEGPKELKDYYFPRSGDVDADGNPERLQIASYMKDMFAYAGHPWQTVKHKVAPLPAMLTEMLDNQDYYGDQIRNADDPMVKQIMQEAQYIGQQVTPFSFRNMQESGKRGDSPVARFGSWVGITPAPREAVRSEAQNKMADYLSQRRMTGATPEDAEARQARAEILAGLRGSSGIDLEAAVTKAIEHEQLTGPDLTKLMKRAGMTPAQEKFKRLSLPQAMEVFKLANDREKGLFAESLAKKIERAQH